MERVNHPSSKKNNCIVMSLVDWTNFTLVDFADDKSNVFVSVTGPDVIITNGTASVTLKCTVTGLVTDVRFMWSNVKCDAQPSDGSTCIFTPIPPQDDGKVVTCTANVSKSDGSGREEASASYAVSLRCEGLCNLVVTLFHVWSKRFRNLLFLILGTILPLIRKWCVIYHWR